jgi:hypothetical protein
MLRNHAVVVIAAFALILAGAASPLAQTGTPVGGPETPPPAGGPPETGLQAPATSGPIQLQGIPVSPQLPPNSSVSSSATRQFEHHDSVGSLPSILMHQWSTTREVPPESLISESYLRTAEGTVRKMTLKEAIYIALRNNPSIKAVELNPVASMESVRQANGAFDPNLTSQVDVIKNVVPATSLLQTGGATAFAQKLYDWNFGINKLSSLTNGTLGIIFNNERVLSNSAFQSVDPSYNPTLAISLSQPLLQNFGWRFATLNVRIADRSRRNGITRSRSRTSSSASAPTTGASS